METMLLLGWMAVPLVAYVGGRLAIGRNKQVQAGRPAVDAERRLEELRRRMAEGSRAPRGRMTEAVLLAEGARATVTLRAP